MLATLLVAATHAGVASAQTSVAQGSPGSTPAQAGALPAQPGTAPVQSGTTPAQPGETAARAGWTVAPEITVRESYTDNAFLGSTPRRRDFVTQVTPALVIDGRTPRLTAHFEYRPSALFYARNSEGDDIVNNLDALGRLEAVERFLFIEALGNVSQHFITPFAPQPPDLTSATSNRVETRTVSLSPYIRSELGRSFQYELRYRNTYTTSNNNTLGDFETSQWNARLGQPVRLFGWALEYEDTDIHREDVTILPDQESRLARARLFFQPSENWRFFASAGREENNFVLQQIQRETIRGAGISWRPGVRTRADLEYEHRFFGPSRLALLTHRTRRTAWNVGYSRDVSTFQEQVLGLPPGNTAQLLDQILMARIPDPVQRAAAVQQFMRATGTPAFLSSSLAFFTQRVFLREGVNGSFGIVGVRNSITFTAFGAETTRISADNAAIAGDVLLLSEQFKQRGFGVHAEHKLTPSTILGASASRILTHQVQPAVLDSRHSHYTLSLNHPMSPKTTAFAGVSVTRFAPEETSASQGAGAVFVGLNHRF